MEPEHTRERVSVSNSRPAPLVQRYPPHPYVEDAESEPTYLHCPPVMDADLADRIVRVHSGQLLLDYPESFEEELEEERPMNPPNTPMTNSTLSSPYGTPYGKMESEGSMDSYDSEIEEPESGSSIGDNNVTSPQILQPMGPLSCEDSTQGATKASTEPQFEPSELETIMEEPAEDLLQTDIERSASVSSGSTSISTSFIPILNEDGEEIDDDDDDAGISVQCIENVEDNTPENTNKSLSYTLKPDRSESPQNGTIGSSSRSLESVLADGLPGGSCSTHGSMGDQKLAEAENFVPSSEPMARESSGEIVPIAVPRGSEEGATRLPLSPRRDVYDPTSLRKPGPVKMESLVHGLARRAGIVQPPSLKQPLVPPTTQEPPPSYEESTGLTADIGVLLKDPCDGNDSESDSDSDSDSDDDPLNPDNEDDLFRTTLTKPDVLDSLIAETKASRSFSLGKEPKATVTELDSDENERSFTSQRHQNLGTTTAQPDYDGSPSSVPGKPPGGTLDNPRHRALDGEPEHKHESLRDTPSTSSNIEKNLDKSPSSNITSAPTLIPLSRDPESVTEEAPRHCSVKSLHSFLEPQNTSQESENTNSRNTQNISGDFDQAMNDSRLQFKQDLSAQDRKGYSDMISMLEELTSAPSTGLAPVIRKPPVYPTQGPTSPMTQNHYHLSEKSKGIKGKVGEEGKEEESKDSTEDESEQSDEPRGKNEDMYSTDNDQDKDEDPSVGGVNTGSGSTVSGHQDGRGRANPRASQPQQGEMMTSPQPHPINKLTSWEPDVLGREYRLKPISSTHTSLGNSQSQSFIKERQGIYSPNTTKETSIKKSNFPKGRYDVGRYTFGIPKETQGTPEKGMQIPTSQITPPLISKPAQRASEYWRYPYQSQKDASLIPDAHDTWESESKKYDIKTVNIETQSPWTTTPGSVPVSRVLYSCPSCGFIDYKERTACLRCSSAPINPNRITFEPHGQLGQLRQCENCGYMGSQRQSTCPGCYSKKAPLHRSVDGQQHFHSDEQLKPRWKPRKNWNCQHCAFHNFRQRTVCNNCGVPAVPPDGAQKGLSQLVYYNAKSSSRQLVKTSNILPFPSTFSKLPYLECISQTKTPQISTALDICKLHGSGEGSYSGVKFAPEKRDYFFNYLRAIENMKSTP